MTQTPRWKPLPSRPGPKRDDPLRIAALRLHGQKQEEAKKRAEHEVRSAQVQVGCRVRVKIEGLAPLQGKVVGEITLKSKFKSRVTTTECWLVHSTKHGVKPYAKAHCEKLKSNEVSRTLRSIGKGKQGPHGPDTIYGDGDI